MTKKLLKNGIVVTEKGKIKTDMIIEDGKIASLGRVTSCSGYEVHDCSGHYIFPGIIDAHVHFNMPCGNEERTIDDFYSGSISAACGGVTTYIDYVEPLKDETPLEALINRRKEADGKTCIDYGFHYVIRKKEEAENLRHLNEIIESGILSFKIFTSYDHMRLSYEEIKKVLKWSADRGVLVTIHAEDENIIKDAQKKLIKNKNTFPSFHGASRPPEAEVEAAKKILSLIDKEINVYFVHVSSFLTAKFIRESREKGYRVIAETCPHYLLLNDQVYKENEKPQLYIMCPPLRNEAERSSLLDMVVNDDVFSVIATDHCAFSPEQKLRSNSFFDTLPGIPGVETLLPLMFSELVIKRKMKVEKLVNILSTKPAKLFGMYPRKGAIKVGSDADLVVYDPYCKKTLQGNRLHSRAGYTPFEGMKITGYPKLTILRGEIIYKNGEFCGPEGYGEFIPGKYL